MVHYEPGPATLTHFPLIAVKKKSVTFSCNVDDPGYPETNRFVATNHIDYITQYSKSILNQTNSNMQKQKIPYITFHTVQALKAEEVEMAYEALIAQNLAKKNPLNKNWHNNTQKQELKVTHALIDLTNHTLCTLLTLTTFTAQTQLLTLYTKTPNSSSTSSTSSSSLSSNLHNEIADYDYDNNIHTPTTSTSTSTFSLYRKMGKFLHAANLIVPPPSYQWLRGGNVLQEKAGKKDWAVEVVVLDTRTNYSCYAENEGGRGAMTTINLDVHAPPFFIKNLPPYTGMLHTSRNANLTCRIECVPRCEISWLKDGVAIEANDTRYFVKEKYMDASPATGDFESMLSVLVSRQFL